MIRLRALWDSIRATYWAVPSLMAAIAVGLSFVTTQLDQVLTSAPSGTLSWAYTGGPEGARAVLSTIAGSMITVAGVTFSITIVALTLASQQFGPRLLRSFLRDLGNQIVLGTFVSTFIYCLLVLRTVRGTDDTQFVPHLAVTLGVVLAMLSLGVLIFFIHHVSVSIQASQIIANVAGDLEGAMRRLFPERLGEGRPSLECGPGSAALPNSFEREAAVVAARSNGYVQAIDGERLLSIAADRDVVLRLDAEPGRFVSDGRALVSVWPAARVDEQLGGALRAAFIIGSARAPTQDAVFYVQQLVELAIRALSPGINDPGTARLCLDRLGQALCQLAGRDLPSQYRYDANGILRIVARPVTFASMADAAFDEIRQHGRSTLSVSLHMLDVIAGTSTCVQREVDRLALLRHASLIWRGGQHARADEADRTALDERYRAAVAALHARARDSEHASPRGASS